MMLMRRPPHCGHIMRSSYGLHSSSWLGIENDADAPTPALRAHHAVLEVRKTAAPCPDQRLKVQLLGVVALPGRVRLLDSAVDAFRMDTPSRRQSIAESFDGHENN
jgi:hypothetical protein